MPDPFKQWEIHRILIRSHHLQPFLDPNTLTRGRINPLVTFFMHSRIPHISVRRRCQEFSRKGVRCHPQRFRSVNIGCRVRFGTYLVIFHWSLEENWFSPILLVHHLEEYKIWYQWEMKGKLWKIPKILKKGIRFFQTLKGPLLIGFVINRPLGRRNRGVFFLFLGGSGKTEG